MGVFLSQTVYFCVFKAEIVKTQGKDHHVHLNTASVLHIAQEKTPLTIKALHSSLKG